MIAWQPGMSLEALERIAIFEAMKFFQNNKAATARALGIAPRTLDNKLEKYAADDKEREVYDEQQRIGRENFLQRQRNGALAGQNRPDPLLLHPNRPVQQQEKSGNGAATGVDAQSASKTPPQQSVPVPQRKEVQGVLSKETPKAGATGRR